MRDRHSMGVEWVCPLDELFTVSMSPAALESLDLGTTTALKAADMYDAEKLTALLASEEEPHIDGIGEARWARIRKALAPAGNGAVTPAAPNPLGPLMQALHTELRDTMFNDIGYLDITFPTINGKPCFALRLQPGHAHQRRTLAGRLNKRAPNMRPWHAYRGGIDDAGLGATWENTDKAAFLKEI